MLYVFIFYIKTAKKCLNYQRETFFASILMGFIITNAHFTLGNKKYINLIIRK